MHTKRSTLAYGAEDSEERRQADDTSAKSDTCESLSAAQTLLHAEAASEPFDAARFPDIENAQTRIRTVREAMPDAPSLRRLAERLKALADPSRVTILNALAISEMRVGELAETVSMSQSAVSHQLRVLRAAQLVAVRREGKNAWYKLADPNLVRLIVPVGNERS